MSTSRDELKPCPFCGSAPELHKDKMLGDAWLGCMNKECTVAPYIEAPDLAERGGEASAREAWNRRAIDGIATTYEDADTAAEKVGADLPSRPILHNPDSETDIDPCTLYPKGSGRVTLRRAGDDLDDSDDVAAEKAARGYP